MSEYCLREGTQWRHGRIPGLPPNSKPFVRALHITFGTVPGLKTPSPVTRSCFGHGVGSSRRPAFQCCRAPREPGLFLGVVGQCGGDDKP